MLKRHGYFISTNAWIYYRMKRNKCNRHVGVMDDLRNAASPIIPCANFRNIKPNLMTRFSRSIFNRSTIS
jgi:hypothetical protein